ncbi:hypothetical protein SVIOM74S_09903 [Streptomyces violarus]
MLCQPTVSETVMALTGQAQGRLPHQRAAAAVLPARQTRAL